MDFEEAIIRSASYHQSTIALIQKQKQRALDLLNFGLRFPNKELEDWKYYDFDSILSGNFKINGSQTFEESSGLNKKEIFKIIEKYIFKETLNNLIVTVNGEYSRDLSNFDFDNDGIKILNFNNSEELDSRLESILSKTFAQNQTSYFEAVNTALFDKGFLVEIAKDYQSEEPLQILHISNRNHFNQIRSLIYAGSNSKLEIIVTYVGIEESQYFTNAVIECFLEQGSSIKLDKIQNDSKKATRLYHYNARLEENSNFEFNSFSFGAGSSKDHINIDIEGKGANANLHGLYVVNQDRKSHHQVKVRHKVSHSSSTQCFKGLLKDNARAEFNGLIEVCKDASQINAHQLNKNLLLSPNTQVNSRPRLNILNDDVKCSHGSSTGMLNEDEIFYLRSRGLSEKEAKLILTYSFCREIIDKIGLESAKNYTSNLAFANLESSESKIVSTLAENSKFKYKA